MGRKEGRQRITVNTCSLDHPATLANYHKETIDIHFPEQAPSFWPR